MDRLIYAASLMGKEAISIELLRKAGGYKPREEHLFQAHLKTAESTGSLARLGDQVWVNWNKSLFLTERSHRREEKYEQMFEDLLDEIDRMADEARVRCGVCPSCDLPTDIDGLCSTEGCYGEGQMPIVILPFKGM